MNLRAMLVGDLTRLRYVERFSTCHKVHRENVAEHTFYVAMYAMLIADELRETLGEHIDVQECMRKALLHDIEECITGDINRLFKHSSEELMQAIDDTSSVAMRVMFARLGRYGGSANYINEWADAKDATAEGRVVKLCDYLAVLAYMVQELTHANITMREHWRTMIEYHESFKGEEFNFLRKYIDDAYEILCTAFKETGDVASA